MLKETNFTAQKDIKKAAQWNWQLVINFIILQV
jgi:hypothetical protein